MRKFLLAFIMFLALLPALTFAQVSANWQLVKDGVITKEWIVTITNDGTNDRYVYPRFVIDSYNFTDMDFDVKFYIEKEVQVIRNVSEVLYYVDSPQTFNYSDLNITKDDLVEGCYDNGDNQTFTCVMKEPVYGDVEKVFTEKRWVELNATTVYLENAVEYDVGRILVNKNSNVRLKVVLNDKYGRAGRIGVFIDGKYYHPWFFFNWGWRKEITFENLVSINLSNYTRFINISYEPEMNVDFSDLRFTYYDPNSGEQEIPYFIYDKVNGSWAYVAVKIPFIPANDNSTVYMYYGNPDASDNSDPNAFQFYDDFYDLNNWIIDNTHGQVYVTSDGFLYLRIVDPWWGVSAYTKDKFYVGAGFEVAILNAIDPNPHFWQHNQKTVLDEATPSLVADVFYHYGSPGYARFRYKNIADSVVSLSTARANNQYHDYYIREFNHELWYYRDTTLQNHVTDAKFSGNIWLRFVAAGIGSWQKIDKVYVRSYVYPEPAYSFSAPQRADMPPVVNILFPPENAYTNENKIEFVVIDDFNSTLKVYVYLNNTLIYQNLSYINNTKITLNPPMQEGSYTLTVVASDWQANGSASRTFDFHPTFYLYVKQKYAIVPEGGTQEINLSTSLPNAYIEWWTYDFNTESDKIVEPMDWIPNSTYNFTKTFTCDGNYVVMYNIIVNDSNQSFTSTNYSFLCGKLVQIAPVVSGKTSRGTYGGGGALESALATIQMKSDSVSLNVGTCITHHVVARLKYSYLTYNGKLYIEGLDGMVKYNENVQLNPGENFIPIRICGTSAGDYTGKVILETKLGQYESTLNIQVKESLSQSIMKYISLNTIVLLAIAYFILRNLR